MGDEPETPVQVQARARAKYEEKNKAFRVDVRRMQRKMKKIKERQRQATGPGGSTLTASELDTLAEEDAVLLATNNKVAPASTMEPPKKKPIPTCFAPKPATAPRQQPKKKTAAKEEQEFQKAIGLSMIFK